MADLREKMKAIRPGHHACLFFDTPEEQARAGAAFLQLGLDRGERAVFLGDDWMVRKLLRALGDNGVDVARSVKNGSLVVTAARDYLQNGEFDAQRTIRFLDEALRQALNDGFTGLRAAGDMAWEMGPSMDLTRMMAYETSLDHYFFGKKLTGLCQYHRQRIPAEYRIHAIQVHPVVVTDDIVCTSNRYYNNPRPADS